jgi:hypothetical protein
MDAVVGLVPYAGAPRVLGGLGVGGSVAARQLPERPVRSAAASVRFKVGCGAANPPGPNPPPQATCLAPWWAPTSCQRPSGEGGAVGLWLWLWLGWGGVRWRAVGPCWGALQLRRPKGPRRELQDGLCQLAAGWRRGRGSPGSAWALTPPPRTAAAAQCA